MSDDDRNAILKRRSRLIQSALLAAGLGVASIAGCDGEAKPDPGEDAVDDTQPQACLGAPADVLEDSTDVNEPSDTQPEACLGVPLQDTLEDVEQG